MAEFLVVIALEVESQGMFETAGVPVLFTGIGKVNAAHALTRRLAEYRHSGKPAPHIVNFGTAGSPTLATGTLVACHSFIQLDMDLSALGFGRGITPFESTPAVLEFPHTVSGLPRGICGSADSFETGKPAIPCHVRDMEAFALAKVCWLEKVPFTCVKYVSDGADHSAATDWEASLPEAAAGFMKVYRQLLA